jgi:hypothetical protein
MGHPRSVVELRGQRHGVRHRCGWRGIVGRVRRRHFSSGLSSGRLCHECAEELFHGQQAVHRIHALRRIMHRTERVRQVA